MSTAWASVSGKIKSSTRSEWEVDDGEGSSSTPTLLVHCPPTVSQAKQQDQEPTMRNTSTTLSGNVLKQVRSSFVARQNIAQETGIRGGFGVHARKLSAAAAATSEPPYHPEPSTSRSTRPVRSSQPLTPERASSYLNSLLSLPSSRPFPPHLALQILTHKSYRGAHLLGYGYQSRTGGAEGAAVVEAEQNGSAPHNSRLAFLGKRALVSYLMMFLHQQALAGAIPSPSTEESAETIAHASPSSSSRTATLTGLNLDKEFGREHAFDEKIANLTHMTNLGREVGQQWGLEDVMRWQNNWTDAVAQQNGALTVQGETVNAVLGGTLMYFGSPAAHRLFHLQVLPYLSRQFKSTPRIQEAIQAQRRVAAEQLDGGIVVP